MGEVKRVENEENNSKRYEEEKKTGLSEVEVRVEKVFICMIFMRFVSERQKKRISSLYKKKSYV